jgi:hypothetical protein
VPFPAGAACCYFAAKDKDIQQPAQKVFITWDPDKQLESFTVQPRFEGNAGEFGMVVPTPTQPRLDEMPRDFFRELAVFTILRSRAYPDSRLVVRGGGIGFGGLGGLGGGLGALGGGGWSVPRPPPVRVVETGLVGTLSYKILTADRANELYDWLKDNDYHYAGDEATLDFYVKKHWFFTVMKIDTTQMRKNEDGSYTGDVTPTRFQFTSAKLVYPLRITRISVRDHTEALLYVQAPYKIDLPGDLTFQFQWIPLLRAAQSSYGKNGTRPRALPGRGSQWLAASILEEPRLARRAEKLGFGFESGRRPGPNRDGRVATTLEWAKYLTADDIGVLRGTVPYTETVPDVDQGFTNDDMKNPRRTALVSRQIERRLAYLGRVRSDGYLVRDTPPEDVNQLRLLVGHLQEGQVLTKLRKIFTKAEMEDDLFLIPAKLGRAEDWSDYEEALSSSPP